MPPTGTSIAKNSTLVDADTIYQLRHLVHHDLLPHVVVHLLLFQELTKIPNPPGILDRNFNFLLVYQLLLNLFEL